MEILIEIDFDSGTRRYSRVGIRTPANLYPPGVVQFGGVQREISLVPQGYSAASVSVTLSNANGEFSRLRGEEAWRNRPLRALLVDPDVGESSIMTAFVGRIETWQLDPQVCQISAVDWIQSRLLRPVSGIITDEFYPDIPDETPRALIPVLIGAASAAAGAIPAYLVDPDVVATGWRYVACQGRVPEPDEVYAYGVLVDSGDYTINYDDGPGGIECTYIDFVADPRVGGDGSEPHVSWNGSGITDDQTESGNQIDNGAEQLALFLRLNGFSSNDLDLNTITTAAAAMTSDGIEGACVVVDDTLRLADVVTQFAENYNLQVFATHAGLVGMAAPDTLISGSESAPEITAIGDIVRGSFSTGGRSEVASTLVAPYKGNFVAGSLTQLKTITNARQVTALGEDVVLRRDFPFIRTDTAMAAVAAVKMFFLREQRQETRSVVPPRWYDMIDIGDTVKLTHFAAVGSQEQAAEDHITDDLVALYRMDEGSGDDLLDTSGEGNDAQLGSAAGADANDPDWVSEGLDFATDGDRVVGPFVLDPDAGDFTVFCIFRVSADGTVRVLLSQETDGGTGRSWLFLDAGDQLNSQLGGAVSQHTQTLVPGQWYMATLRLFGTTLSLFIDGGDKEDFTITPEAEPSGGLLLGVNPPATTTKAGRVALVAVYDAALSDTQVATNTVSLKRIVNAKVSPPGFYRVLGSSLVTVGRSLAVELKAVDLAQEPLVDLFVPPVPESKALIDGSSLVQAHLGGKFGLAASIAGVSAVTANLRQNFITDGLQHLWPFLDGSGTTLTDVVGSAHGTLGGEGGGAGNRPAWGSGGLEFDGVDDWVTFTNFQAGATGSWTIAVAFQSQADARTILSQRGTVNRADWLAHTGDGVFASGLPASPNPVLEDGSITSGVWYVGFIRRNGSTGELRLNLVRTGSAQVASSTPSGLNQVTDGFFALGVTSFEFGSAPHTAFEGVMAMKMHWNRRLSDAEVTTAFNGIKSALAPRGISV
jgi:hypothetical protein